MDPSLRPVTAADEPFLWSMLFEASHAADDGLRGPADLRSIPELARYVEGWGQPTDLGLIATAGRGAGSTELGAAWVRLLTGDRRGYGYVDDETPELAIAVGPGLRGQGLGARLLDGLLAAARPRFPGVCLSVRADNPARRLYERTGFRPLDGSAVTNRAGGTSITLTIRFPTA
jgi:ribosomal protein S18 acetylase RimI-like enzyme